MADVQLSRSERQRAAYLKWRDVAPGMPADLAMEFMDKLIGGSTIRKLTSGIREFGPAIVSYERFKKHCELDPEWGAEAWQISRKNCNAGKSARFRAMTHCKRGHPLAGASRYQMDGYIARHCRICRAMRARRPAAVTSLQKAKVVELLKRRTPISHFTSGSGFVVSHVTFTHLRQVDAEINSLALVVLDGAVARGQKLRWSRLRNQVRREQENDYFKIRAMLPAGLPGRDDVVSLIFEDLLTGTLKREDVRSRIRGYIAAHNQTFATKYRKFGDSPLLSLDEAIFDDGSGTRGDNVSRGLWD
ncbi:hypothetical protein FJN17_12180 [Bradyrhizobium symbiodeficiens]|uniref:Uncharacterized protein n=1 Tax=Bradyrhizobium symbiodeficiens TaxID=1404367 RepID=A0ABX5W4Q0_9BRAD|nr:hypothetical protein [Bradyrhizobium symbiodeficiens]QDF38265.1 hypothetical protein FJN17_12180 [Bradyrhizobium symbiodeficiens]